MTPREVELRVKFVDLEEEMDDIRAKIALLKKRLAVLSSHLSLVGQELKHGFILKHEPRGRYAVRLSSLQDFEVAYEWMKTQPLASRGMNVGKLARTSAVMRFNLHAQNFRNWMEVNHPGE